MALIGISGKKQAGKDTVGLIIQLLMEFPEISNHDIIEKYIKVNERISNPTWKIKKFAGKLKEIVSIITGHSVEALENDDVKNSKFMTSYQISNGIDNYGTNFATVEDGQFAINNIKHLDKENMQLQEIVITPRLLLQQIGTDIGRSINPNIWVESLMSEYKSNLLNNGEFVTNVAPNGSKLSWVPNPIMEPESFPNWIITDVRFLNEVKAIKSKHGIVIRVERKKRVRQGKYYIYKDIKETNINEHISETALDNCKDFDYTILNAGSLEDLIHTIRKILKQEYDRSTN